MNKKKHTYLKVISEVKAWKPVSTLQSSENASHRDWWNIRKNNLQNTAKEREKPTTTNINKCLISILSFWKMLPESFLTSNKDVPGKIHLLDFTSMGNFPGKIHLAMNFWSWLLWVFRALWPCSEGCSSWCFTSLCGRHLQRTGVGTLSMLCCCFVG